MTIPLLGANGNASALIVPENMSNPGGLVGSINAGTFINTPGKRLHGQSRPPIRDQEVIDQLNPIINKESKSVEDMQQESKKLYELVTIFNTKLILLFQLFELKRRLDELEIRVKSLDKENKDTQFNNSQLINDLAKARERE